MLLLVNIAIKFTWLTGKDSVVERSLWKGNWSLSEGYVWAEQWNRSQIEVNPLTKIKNKIPWKVTLVIFNQRNLNLRQDSCRKKNKSWKCWIPIRTKQKSGKSHSFVFLRKSENID
jgi:hypothetical protein